MRKSVDDLETMKAWLTFFFDRYLAARGFANPFPAIDVAKAPSKARKALTMARNDMLEMTSSWREEEVRAADEAFAGRGLPTLSQLHLQSSRKIDTILKRGGIKDDTEYYAVRNFVEAIRDDEVAARLLKLLDAFEEGGGE